MTAIRIHPGRCGPRASRRSPVATTSAPTASCGGSARCPRCRPRWPHGTRARCRPSRPACGAGDRVRRDGEELQVRAAAAELADAPGEARAAAAARRLVSASSSAARDPRRRGRRGAARSARDRAGPPGREPSGRGGRGRRRRARGGAAAGRRRAGEHVRRPRERQARAAIDPGDMPAGEHRAEHVGQAPADAPAPAETDRQDWACWMASAAAHEGLPPALPVMMALAAAACATCPAARATSGSSASIRGGVRPPGPGRRGAPTQPGEWWADHPGAQLDHVVARLGSAGGGTRDAGSTTPRRSGAGPRRPCRTSTRAVRRGPRRRGRARRQLPHGARRRRRPAGGPLAMAQGQLGVHEVGDERRAAGQPLPRERRRRVRATRGARAS